MDLRNLGPYEIVEQLGEGGMGAVYLAQDTRLGRKVAVKVLPQEFARDPERLARFEQEARAAASLNHPHIAAVFDVGESEGVHYMVQERLEGETLRSALGGGPLPRRSALALAAEIAEGLAAAHAAGIVHRDLKPDNIFVSPSGHAKILDFGLAKLTDPEAAHSGPASGDRSRSPTMIGTMAGTVMGSAGYMAPEQVAGGAVDRRTDLFALGCVLYEMTTGERAFAGETLIDTLHAIARNEPDLLADPDPSRLDPDLRWVLEKCLAKSPSDRFQHADDLAVDLRRLAAGRRRTPATAEQAPSERRTGAPAIAWTVAAIALLAAAAAWWWAAPAASSDRVSLTLPAHIPPNSGSRYFALSPDGETAVYLVPDGGESRLVFRRLESFDETPVVGSEGAVGPFFSPDGRRLAFFASGRLWAVDVAGGSPRAIADVAQYNSTGFWGEDGAILFVSWATERGLLRVSARGDEVTEIAPWVAGDFYYVRPRPLPGGDGVSVESGIATNDRFTRLFFLDGSPSIRIPRPQVTYLDEEIALFVDASSLFRASYDPASWEITGEPQVVAEDVVDYSVTTSGDLVYVAGVSALHHRILRRTRDGAMVEQIAEDPVDRPRISPDGTRLAASSAITGQLLRLWDLDRASGRMLEEAGLYPQWGPSSDTLYFRRQYGAEHAIARLRLGASGGAETLLTADRSLWPTDVSPDGAQLLYYEIHPETERDLWVLPLDPPGEPRPWLVTPASERSAVFSPDGRWVAYLSDTGDVDQVYVRPAPSREGAAELVTIGAGREPRWSPDGSELFFRRDDGMWAVPVAEVNGRFTAGSPELLFRGRFAREEGGRNQQYDVFPNGDFLTLELPDETAELRVVKGWRSSLDR